MKVAVGNIVALNAGDAAILAGTERILRAALGDDLEIAVFDPDAAAARRYYDGFDFHPSIWRRLTAWAGSGARTRPALALLLAAALATRAGVGRPLRALLPAGLRDALARYAAADVVVASGGTYLMPNYAILPKLCDLMVALALGRPLVLFTQSIGSFEGRRIRWPLGFCLRRAALVVVRDAASERHVAAMGVPAERIVRAGDAAFALAETGDRVHGLAGSNRPLRLAVSVRHWPHFEAGSDDGMRAYVGAVAGMVERLLADGRFEVTFLSTCQGMEEYWTDDAATADLVVASLPPALRGRVAVDRRHRQPAELVTAFAGFDAVVATRMHAAILALCAGRPAVAVAYEFKTAELFGQLGLAGFSHAIGRVDGPALAGSVEALRREWGDLAPAVWRRVDELRASAFDAGVAVRRALGTG